MKIFFPGFTQKDFEYAIECLEDCKQPDASAFGFHHPYFTPGGGYGKQWWQVDSALALSGYKWIDRTLAETALLNFIESQKDDGRICLWGNDILPAKVAGGDVLPQREGVSSLPKIFDAAYHILQGTTNTQLLEKTYSMLAKYLDWWYRDRFDPDTGLITAVFEETFRPYLGCAMEYAAVDTNVEVYVGLIYTADLAQKLGLIAEAEAFRRKAEELKVAINTTLWNAEKEAYYPYDVRTGEHIDCLLASTFFPLRMQIATDEQKSKLITLLKDDSHFNWNTIPLTSVSKKDPTFQVTDGCYMGNASWSGNVWTIINEMVIRGLLDCGEKELAADLALKTVRAFHRNCTEFVNPFDGVGHSVEKYAWSASQYLELMIEVIFGVSINADRHEVSVSPNLTEELKRASLSLTGLMIFDNEYLDVMIENGIVHYNIRSVLQT